ncbi:MAG: molybdopterin cofactor-binding domain-containing protein [Gemmatimonadales bacterium]
MAITRRGFVGTCASVGLTLGFRAPVLANATGLASFDPNVFLSITPDDVVTVWVTKLEMGQGVRTLLPMLIAEELEAEWSRLRVEQAWPGGKFKGLELHTSGSSSAGEHYLPLRQAGAAAREMLVGAAAEHWKVDIASCRAERGVVHHLPSNRRLRFGELAARAARQPVPKTPRLKPPAEFTLIGRPTRRVDGRSIVTGAARYGLDVTVPGMLFATIERAPTLGGRLVRFDPAAALRVPGVREVRAVTAGVHPGVAVLADDTWSAQQGRAALMIEWAPGPGTPFDSDRFLASLPAALAGRQFKVRHEGDATTALSSSVQRIGATYTFPFQAHAPLETQSCTADVRGDRAELWVSTQTDVRTLQQAARVTGLAEDRITLHPMLVGGGFGRRLFADFVAEAVQLSRDSAKPVQLLWTRQDEIRHGYFQPATIERFEAGLSHDGTLTALVHLSSASDLTIYDIHEGRNIWTDSPKPAKADNAYAEDETPWGAFDTPYEFPTLRVDCVDVTSPVPCGPWRAVEYPSTVFGRESFLDEVAHATKRDPIDFRLALLPADVRAVGARLIDRRRLRAVLETVRERSGWETPLAHSATRWWGRGVAANVYHAGSYLAMVAEVSVARDFSDLRVHRIVTAVDCGVALNPLGITGQTESGITWGLSATLFGKMDFQGGAPVQSSYRDFRVMTIDRMPTVETVILPSDAAPKGFGEHPVPTVAPAVANAVYAACGRRIRDLPITPEKLVE